MNRVTQTAAVLLCALLLAFGAVGGARAQAVTTSAVAGRVTDNGQGVAGAQVTATNTENGAVARTVTSTDGRYTITGLAPGGYTLTVSRLGLQTSTRSGVRLTLGQTAQNDFVVSSGAVALTGITAVAERNPIISSGRTGSSTVVSDSTLRRSPSLTRDLQDFTRLVPQLAVTNSSTGAVSAGGRNNRFNNLQIDGAANNDLFGLSGSGSPAGQANGKSITLEAIQEVQVVIAPYDVRQSGFTGASVNAITRSGTNKFQGGISGYQRNESLTGLFNTFADTSSLRLRDFSQGSYSGSFGGPIIRDKAFFFLAGELGRRQEPGLYAAGDNVLLGVTKQQADLLAQQLAALGYDAGTTGPKSYHQPNTNLFGRLDFNLSANNRLTIRNNWVSARRENIGRNSTSNYTLGNADYVQVGKTNSLVAQLNSGFGGRFFNELRVGYLTERDHRETPGDPFPRVTVTMSSGRSVIAGTENSSVANVLRQNVLEITNDLSMSAGAHNLTLGTSNQLISFYNLFFQNGYGIYTFASDSLFLAGRPSSFQVQHLAPGGQAAADFNVRSLSAYLQDRWNATDNLVVTLGLRLDNSSLPDKPSFNPLVAQYYDSINRSTSNVPDPGIIFSPRFGFNWDVTGDKTTQLRGGAGLFAGRPLYVWISNLYGNTGVDYINFRCADQASSPTFVADPLNQPTACAAGGTPNRIVNTADPNLKPPQVARYDLAVDRQLPLGLVATVEGIYTKTVHDLFYRDYFLVADSLHRTVEGRPRLQLSTATPGVGDVFDVVNTKQGYTYSMTAQLQRPWRDDWEASIAYTYGHAKDLNSLTSSVAQSNFQFNLARFDPNNPELATSNYDIPNRVVANASKRFHFFRGLPTDFTVVYIGQSGLPYSYAYNGDINSDGFTSNDLMYVPKNVNDIIFAGTATVSAAQSAQNLDNFIQSVDCLREARGTILKRNACRLPWSGRVDVKFQQNLHLMRNQTAQFTVDVVNFGNLLNSEWGRQYFIANQSDLLLSPTAAAATAEGRRTYSAFNGRVSPFNIADPDSRYQIQLGMRLGF